MDGVPLEVPKNRWLNIHDYGIWKILVLSGRDFLPGPRINAGRAPCWPSARLCMSLVSYWWCGQWMVQAGDQMGYAQLLGLENKPQKIVLVARTPDSSPGSLSLLETAIECIVLAFRFGYGFRFFGWSLFCLANFFFSSCHDQDWDYGKRRSIPFCQLAAPVSSIYVCFYVWVGVRSVCLCERKSWETSAWAAASDCHFGSNQFFWLPNAKLADGGGFQADLRNSPASKIPKNHSRKKQEFWWKTSLPQQPHRLGGYGN